MDSLRPHIELPEVEWAFLANQFLKAAENDKVTFAEFLQLTQHDAFYREVLIEHLIKRQTASRMFYAEEKQLLTKKYLEAVKRQKEKDGDEQVKVPSFEYDIEDMILFEFVGVTHMMIFYSNKSIQLFEYETGTFVYEFDFDNKSISGQEEKLYELPGMSGTGLGVITNCEHWQAEAKNARGGALSDYQANLHFKDSQRCDKCALMRQLKKQQK